MCTKAQQVYQGTFFHCYQTHTLPVRNNKKLHFTILSKMPHLDEKAPQQAKRDLKALEALRSN
jgi:hypothetical protein